jgi:hypothetical protein
VPHDGDLGDRIGVTTTGDEEPRRQRIVVLCGDHPHHEISCGAPEHDRDQTYQGDRVAGDPRGLEEHGHENGHDESAEREKAEVAASHW